MPHDLEHIGAKLDARPLTVKTGRLLVNMHVMPALEQCQPRHEAPDAGPGDRNFSMVHVRSPNE
jgi:hypothetical protein